MKPFNLALAKFGCPIVTRAGRPVRFIAHAPEITNLGAQVIVSVDEGHGLHRLLTTFACGKYIDDEETAFDLFHPSTKKSGWINLFAPTLNNPDVRPSAKVWNTREYTETAGKMCDNYITTIEIHWEE